MYTFTGFLKISNEILSILEFYVLKLIVGDIEFFFSYRTWKMYNIRIEC